MVVDNFSRFMWTEALSSKYGGPSSDTVISHPDIESLLVHTPHRRVPEWTTKLSHRRSGPSSMKRLAQRARYQAGAALRAPPLPPSQLDRGIEDFPLRNHHAGRRGIETENKIFVSTNSFTSLLNSIPSFVSLTLQNPSLPAGKSTVLRTIQISLSASSGP